MVLAAKSGECESPAVSHGAFAHVHTLDKRMLEHQRHDVCCGRVPEECPHEVEQLIEACQEQDPDLRPSALEIVRTLQRIARPQSFRNSSIPST